MRLGQLSKLESTVINGETDRDVLLITYNTLKGHIEVIISSLSSFF
jgi:hypothetical protein